MSKTAPTVFPGEPMPKLVLPDIDGKRVDLTHQSVAGRTEILLAPSRMPWRPRP